MEIQNYKKILVVGDSGRGKSTLAKNLSKKLGIKHIELDDLFWVEKYTVRRTDEQQIELVQNILSKESSWVIEGSTRHMVSLCLEPADCIIHLSFKNIFSQWYQIIKRNEQRRESCKNTFDLCLHVFKKRYGLGNSKGKKIVKEMIMPYSSKVIELNSWKKINKFVECINEC